jgi:methylated-DNA-[protein]-cysteine S-methyltransferase
MLATDRGLSGLFMENHIHGPIRHPDWIRDEARFVETCRQLDTYFSGRLRTFDLRLDLQGQGTLFQLRAWEALLEIPFGETISYGEQALRVGNPKASRAVGLANGRNPISIIIPCHRVVGKNGSLTGYGGGLDRKCYLLDFEKGLRI